MSQLEAAQRHLTHALRRLETALEHRLTRPVAGSAASDSRALAAATAERDELARNLAMLHEQCDRLSVALNEAEHDNRSLRETNGHIGRRLEGSIAELDRLLGS
jgi:septal ring factor EnvC (AmiA/AmiB activator)